MLQTTHSHIRPSFASRTFDVINSIVMVLVALGTLGPFVYLVLGSLTERIYYQQVGVAINPAHWSLNAYVVLLSSTSTMLQAMKVSLFVTVVGTLLGIAVTSSLAYVTSRTELPGHRLLVFLIFFTMLFSGGMVPFYLIVRSLGMTNRIWGMIIPFMSDAWFIFIMVKFYDTLPAELQDAARIDGCTEVGIFTRIVLPLSKPVLATIGLFFAVFFWNDWFWPSILIQNPSLLPVQQTLRSILSVLSVVINPRGAIEQQKLAAIYPPMDVMRMACIILTVLPIVVVYPFLQKYFVKGVMIGAIKG
jgi:putative aldouronate transport system permease protein